MSNLFAKKIKNLRLERGFTQEELSQKLGVSRQRYARVESGTAQITLKILEKLADVYKIRISEITDVNEGNKSLGVLFRENNIDDASYDVISKIQDILEYMGAHERLYMRMKDKNENR